jgi:predicted dinucleotide-binding enzyme
LAAALDGATVGAAGAAPAGDIVVLAVPYESAAAVVGEYGDALHGKVLIDITNPITPDFAGFVTPEGSSGSQEIAKAAPAGAHVVKAFNTLFANVLADGPAEGDPMDAGQLPMARAPENAALLQLGLRTHSVKHTNFFLGVNILS